MARKTKTEREQERAVAEQRAWEELRPKLAALESFVDAKLLAGQSPPPDSPGRSYYSNLAFFLQEFVVPGGSSYEERLLYLRFIQRLDSAGALEPGAGEEVGERLRRSMEE
ncbi:MAG: hypothetical protein M3426_13555 [Actinomycetota bacterium]|nr:hypothetical protein [Actinomycetota bacterium]